MISDAKTALRLFCDRMVNAVSPAIHKDNIAVYQASEWNTPGLKIAVLLEAPGRVIKREVEEGVGNVCDAGKELDDHVGLHRRNPDCKNPREVVTERIKTTNAVYLSVSVKDVFGDWDSRL